MEEQRWVKKTFSWVGAQGGVESGMQMPYDAKIGLDWDQKMTRYGQYGTEE